MALFPIHKVGVCALSGDRVLLVKPVGKQSDSAGTPWVLPRGTRAWRDAHGALVDARTQEAALQHEAALEDMRDTAMREAHEEAGIPPALSAQMVALGARDYYSESGKGSYPIMWFMLQLTAQQLPLLETPADSVATRFFTLGECAALVASGEARQGYLDVMQWAFSAGA